MGKMVNFSLYVVYFTTIKTQLKKYLWISNYVPGIMLYILDTREQSK